VLLGEASYALYIIHHPFWRWMLVANRATVHAKEDSLVFFSLYLIILIAVSVASFLWVEKPAKNLLKRLLFSAKTTAPRVAA
jgi:peptidoglycan/LPS O-acetylase OafA/YrhL